MKFNKDKLLDLLKQKTTWVGVVALLVAGFGLPTGSEEQLAGFIAGIVGLIYPEETDAA
jgi:hypothetical protein